jgi:uncharacterized protein
VVVGWFPGSRAYGYASALSDVDVCFVFARTPAHYLREYAHQRRRQDTESHVHTYEHEGHAIDLCGWDLSKFLRLLSDSNANTLEWLRVPREQVYVPMSTAAVHQGEALATCVERLVSQQLDVRRVAHAYLTNARTNLHTWMLDCDVVPHKQYLYVIRPLLCIRWLRLCRTPEHHDVSASSAPRYCLPPLCFDRLVKEQCATLDPEFLAQLSDLVARKQQNRLSNADRPLLILQG